MRYATSARPATLIATLRGQPQVVTFALDALLAAGETIDRLVVLYLADPTGRTANALAKLAAEFSGNHYRGRRLHYRPHLIRAATARQPLPDIYNETDANAVWEAVFSLLAAEKAGGRPLHVCISGGRRILALLTMSAAMLQFGHHDRLWHMYTPEHVRQAADEGALMHLPDQPGTLSAAAPFRLMHVPMMPWGTYFPMLRQLAQPGGQLADVLARPRAFMEAGERSRCETVIAQLTNRQQDVLRAFAAGHSPQEVAEQLHITLKTVDTHKTAILRECRSAWALQPDSWLDYHFLREKFEDYFR